MKGALKQARELLAGITPLKTDCGRVCGARCCRSLEGEETGMLGRKRSTAENRAGG